MKMEGVIVGLVLAVFIATFVDGQTFSLYIPIGTMFDHSSLETMSAFKSKLMMENDNQGRLMLQNKMQNIDMQDSYSAIIAMCNLMRNGIFTLFGTHTMETINTIKSFSKTFQMPFITPSMAFNRTDQELGYEIYMRPLYTGALVDIIKYYEWSSVYYIYNSNEGLQRLQQLMDALADDETIVYMDMRRVVDVNDAWDTLQLIDQKEEGNKHILLDLPTKDCENLLIKQEKDPRRVRFHYLLVGLGIDEIRLEDYYKHGGINITGFRLIDFSADIPKKFLSVWSNVDRTTLLPGAVRNKVSFEAALAADSISLIKNALTRMTTRDPDVFKLTLMNGKIYNNNSVGIDCDAEPVIPWKHGYDIMKTLRGVEFYGLSGKIAFDKFGLRRNYKLDLLEVNLNRALAKIGSWDPEGGLVVQPPSIERPKANGTISNITRIITSIVTSPYLNYVMPEPGEKMQSEVKFEGYCADLAAKIAEFINCDYKISPVKDGKYGALDENGTWNGMVGELIRNEAHLAIAPLTITSVREKVIDFSKPFMSLGISIMIKKPEKEIPGVFSFMYPLSYEIWMCVIFAYIGVSVVLFLVSRFSPFEWHIEDNTDGPTVTNNFTIFNSLWFSLGAFMQQGCDIEPRSISGRIVGSVWWFFTLIIISSYTANLAAFLTVERMQSPIESADDLAKQTQIKYGTVDSGSTKSFFKTSTIPVYERMWAFMSSDPSVFVSSNEEGVKRVKSSNGRYAFLVESTTNDYINQQEPCDTMKVGSNLDSKGYGIGTPLGSELRDRVTLAVLELREKGQLQKLEKKWWYEKGKCGKQSQAKKGDITSSRKLDNVAGLFYILIGGLCLALFVAVLEFLYKSKVEAKRKKTSFSNAVRTKARLSIKGTPDHQGPQATAVGPPEMPPNMSMSTYTYAPAAQLISLDGYADGNTHTQV